MPTSPPVSPRDDLEEDRARLLALVVSGLVVGALIMQSLDSGMLLLDVSIGKRMLIIGQVLIVAVVFDVLYRRKFGER